MATTRFTVKRAGTYTEVVYYGYNCPREGEYIELDGLLHQVISVTHVPKVPHHTGWEDITIKVSRGV